jgi:PAS domain S-box-containing protein
MVSWVSWPKRQIIWSQLPAVVLRVVEAARSHEPRRTEPESLRDEQLLLRLGEELPRFEAVEPLLSYTVTQLGDHLGVSACGCIEHDLPAGTFVARAEHMTDGASPSGMRSLSDYPPDVLRDLQRGRVLSISDVQRDVRTRDRYSSMFGPAGARAVLCLPVLRDHVWVATFYLVSAEVRFWTTLEQQLAQTVGERAWLWVERIRMLRALRASESKYRHFIENTSEGVWEIDAEGRTNFVNARMAMLLGYSEPELMGAMLTDFMDDKGRQEAMALMERRRSGVMEAHDFRFQRKDGSTLWGRVEASPVYDAAGAFQGALAMVADISERKQAEVDQLFLLRVSELFTTANDPLLVYTQVLSQLGEHLGLDRCLIARVDPERGEATVEHEWMSAGLESLRGTHSVAPYGGVLPDTLQARAVVVNDCHADARMQAVAAAFEAIAMRAMAVVPMVRDGRTIAVVVLSSRAPYIWSPRTTALTSVLGERSLLCVQRLENIRALRDMSRELERRVEARTAQLTALVAEKEVLLKEIHHRVKNNLQVISSLLNLQSMHINDAAAAAVLSESRGRVHSIALVHEILYESQELSRLDFAAYIRSLVQTVVQAQSVPACAISTVIEAESVRMPLAMAIPCGLLINELLTNSLKHAFVGRKRGNISVRLSGQPGDRVLLEVADDGVGLPVDKDVQALRSLGLDLVYTFAEQLGARVEVERTGGTRFCFSFGPAHLP